MKTLNDLVLSLVLQGKTDRQITRFISSNFGIKPAATKIAIRDVYSRVIPAAVKGLV